MASVLFSDLKDERIICSSQLYTKFAAGETLIKPQKVMSGEKCYPLPLGDGAYPQTSWLVKPYLNNIDVKHT